MQKKLFALCDWKTYIYTTVEGYAYHDELLNLDCFLYRKDKKHTWVLYDCCTGLNLNAFGVTKKDALEAWEIAKNFKGVTRELVINLQNTFIERRNNAMKHG